MKTWKWIELRTEQNESNKIETAEYRFSTNEYMYMYIDDYKKINHDITDSTYCTMYVQCKYFVHRFIWKKNGVEVPNSQVVAVDKKTGTITFSGVDLSDFGTYQCFASNEFGTALSNPFKLERAGKHLPTMKTKGCSVLNDVEFCPLFVAWKRWPWPNRHSTFPSRWSG